MGHETKEDIEKLVALERKTSTDKGDVSNMLELSSFYIEPFHKEDKAIALLNRILALNPEYEIAKLWLCFCHIHYSMDKSSLLQAEKLLRSMISNNVSKQKGAVFMLLAETLDDLEKINLMEQIDLLEQSVFSSPDWVLNRYVLAGAYKKFGSLSKAIEQMDCAINNISPINESLKHSEVLYETSITGRFREVKFFQTEKERFLKE